jgi:DNA-binding transcriptional LysR family regulator
MDRLRRINQLWNWLPAFRAVAETEHLPSASALLGVSPSALSRTIKLVEEDVGRPLFDREGRQLRLNANGRAFLRSVRDAMRRVHDGLGEISGGSLSGKLRVAITGPARLLFVPRLLELLGEQHGDLEPELLPIGPGEEVGALMRGAIDVAFISSAVESETTEIERLGQLRTAVFCGEGHELYERPNPTRAQILESAFVCVPPGPAAHLGDGWPLEIKRKMGVRVPTLEAALELCESGRYLAVLPELVHTKRPVLRRLAFGGLPPMPLFSSRREQLSSPAKAEACVSVMRRIVRELT